MVAVTCGQGPEQRVNTNAATHTLPFKSSRDTVLPDRSVRVKSGTGIETSGFVEADGVGPVGAQPSEWTRNRAIIAGRYRIDALRTCRAWCSVRSARNRSVLRRKNAPRAR